MLSPSVLLPEENLNAENSPLNSTVLPLPGQHDSGNAPLTADKQKAHANHELALWRLETVLAHVPLSRSSWLAGVKDGIYPKPVRISARRVAWRASEIASFVASLSDEG
jgi:prophage regulatory protein